MTDLFDAEYRARREIFGAKPSWRLETFVGTQRLGAGAQALDLGCGQGRDTLFLAERGIHVDAYDLSSAAVRSLEAVGIARPHLSIRAEQKDIAAMELPAFRYDVIVARTILDHLPSGVIPAVIGQMKQACRIGGAIFATTFTVDDPGSTGGSSQSEFAPAIQHYFQRGELLGYFHDFRLLAYEEVVKEDRSHGTPHLHGKARIAAVRIA